MDTNKNTAYQVVQNFLNTSETIDEEEKIKYLVLLTNLTQGKLGDLETLKDLNNLLEGELKRLEDTALAAKDTEQINLLADLRNARLELQKQLLGITES